MIRHHMTVLAIIIGLTGISCGNVQVAALQSLPNQGALFPAIQGGGNFRQLTDATATINLSADSQVVITLTALGTIIPLDTGSSFVPPLFVQCQMDGAPCATTTVNTVPFLYPVQSQGDICCAYDTRTMTWVLARVARGSHTITIWGQFGQPALSKMAEIFDWSLVVEGIAQ
jgi:hypothetical protein